MSIFEPNIEGFGQPIYPLSPEQKTNAAISAILNEARHVYEWHAEGLWNEEYKDGFANLLVPYVKNHPKLIKSILNLEHRVFSIVTYRAVELSKK